MLQPMALTVMGALIIATLFTLIFLPCCYLLAHGAKEALVRFLQRMQPEGMSQAAPPRTDRLEEVV